VLFDVCAAGLIDQGVSTSLTHWLSLDGEARVVELLNRIRASRNSGVFDQNQVREIALRGLLYKETQASRVPGTLLERLKDMRNLVQRKGRDYNAGGVSILDYWILGPDSIFHEIHKRCLRLVSLSRAHRPAEYEAEAESGLDLAAFCVFLLAYLDLEM